MILLCVLNAFLTHPRCKRGRLKGLLGLNQLTRPRLSDSGNEDEDCIAFVTLQ